MCIRMDPLVACVRVAPVSGQDDHLEPLKELVVQLFGQNQSTLQRVLKSCIIRMLLNLIAAIIFSPPGDLILLYIKILYPGSLNRGRAECCTPQLRKDLKQRVKLRFKLYCTFI
jgi:hypothetical protein